MSSTSFAPAVGRLSPTSPRIRSPWLACLLIALLAALAAASTLARAAGGATDFRCPATLAQMPVADGMPPGWILHAQPGQWRLQRATFYDGDPVGLATLVPDATHRNGQTETSTWHFGADGVVRDSAKVWLACLYRDATAVVTRPLPAGLHQCTTVLRLTPLGDPLEPVSVACR